MSEFRSELENTPTVEVVRPNPEEENVFWVRTSKISLFWFHFSRTFGSWAFSEEKHERITAPKRQLIHAFLGQAKNEYFLIKDSDEDFRISHRDNMRFKITKKSTKDGLLGASSDDESTRKSKLTDFVEEHCTM